ncbi:MAG: hypothetical protein JO142_05140 [Burkholderiales bacterium]|nr:hypothetical protein [Burkholderiales bacterium]
MHTMIKKPVWSRMAMVALALSLGSAAAFADEAASGESNDNGVHPVDAIKKAGKEVGHGVKEGAIAVGHGVRDGAIAVGHGTKKVVHKVGHAIKHGVHKIEGKKDDPASEDKG